MKKIFIYSLFALLIVGCKKKEHNFEGGDVVFSADIHTTKASFDKNTFASGDKVWVWITDDKALANQYNYVDKATFEYTGSVFAVPAGDAKITYPKSDSKLKFWAIYPYVASEVSLSGTQQFAWSVNVDQTTEANYNASDLVTAQNTAGATSGSAVELKFYHRMAKMIPTITSIPNSYKGLALTGVTVNVYGQTDATVSLNGTSDTTPGTVSATGEVKEIKAHEVVAQSEYEALVAPHTYAVGEPVFVVNANYGGTVVPMQFTANAAVALASGQANKISITVTDAMQINATFTVTDWVAGNGGSGELRPAK